MKNKVSKSERADIEKICRLLPKIPVITADIETGKYKQLTREVTWNGAKILKDYNITQLSNGERVKKGRMYKFEQPLHHDPFDYFLDIIANKKILPEDLPTEIKKWQDKYTFAMQQLNPPLKLKEVDEKTYILPADATARPKYDGAEQEKANQAAIDAFGKPEEPADD